MIGPVNSGESLATVPIVSKAGIPNLIIGAIDELVDPRKFPRAFRAINTNRQWIVAANDYTLKHSKIAIIGDTSGYGTSSEKTATELLEKAGVKPVFSTLIDPNKTDLTDELAITRLEIRLQTEMRTIECENHQTSTNHSYCANSTHQKLFAPMNITD